MEEQRLGHYRLIERRQAGAGDETWTAWDTRVSERADVHLLPALDRSAPHGEAFFSFFQQELRMLTGLRHPNVSQPTDFAPPHTERAWYAEPHVDGISLSELMRANGAMTWEAAALIVHELAAALTTVHARGLAHGHLRPDAVLVQRSGRVLLTRFGLVLRALVASRTSEPEALQELGDGSYMAPEVLSLQRADAVSDTFALGIIAYELLTALKPFDGAAEVIEYARGDFEAPDPWRFAPTVPEPMREMVRQMLASDPAARLTELEPVVAELEGLLRMSRIDQPRPMLRKMFQEGTLAYGMPAPVPAADAPGPASAGSVAEEAHDKAGAAGREPADTPRRPQASRKPRGGGPAPTSFKVARSSALRRPLMLAVVGLGIVAVAFVLLMMERPQGDAGAAARSAESSREQTRSSAEVESSGALPAAPEAPREASAAPESARTRAASEAKMARQRASAALAQGRIGDASRELVRSDSDSGTEGHLRAARLLAANSRCEDAVPLLEEIVERGVRTVEVFRLLGSCLLELGRSADAVEALGRVVELEPGDEEAALARARLLEAAGRKDEAVRQLTALLEVRPDDREATVELARIEASSGRAASASQRIAGLAGDEAAGAETLDTAALAAFRTGSYEKAAELYRRAIAAAEAAGSRPDVRLLRNLAVSLDRSGRRREAVEAYERALAADGDDAELHFRVGSLLAAQGRERSAGEHFEAVLALDPRHLGAGYELGLSELRWGRAAQAAGRFRQVLEVAPGHEGALGALGKAQIQLGRKDEAIATFRRLAAVRPRDPAPMLTVAALLQDTGRSSELEAALAEACRRGAKEACR